jgi:lipopolysaccharide/colanic/teichoic acid biosynthesis glycosyltransferase
MLAGNPEPGAARVILSENEFHRMISLERKRTERSRKPFLLMLLDMGQNISACENGLEKISQLLSLITRETDILGWYKDDLVVGALFTDIDLSEKEQILNIIFSRVRGAVQDAVTPQQFNRMSISFYWYPEEVQQILSRKPDVPVLYPDLAKKDEKRKFNRILKRGMDIVGSLLALLIGSPLFLLIALAIKLTSKGPVFFRQQRVGQYGAPFHLLKFRSMHTGNNNKAHREYVAQLISGVAEKKPSNGNGAAVYKLTGDPRITPIGAFLRRSSLDELPQFINVLKGEMSLVGPRPPIDYEVERYDLWHRRRVMEAKPGITGLWQVNGRNRLAFDEMVRLDLMYARSWSPWLDLKILLRTPKAVVAGAH